MFRSEAVTKHTRSSGGRMDEKKSGLREEPVSRPNAFFDPSPRTNIAFVNAEGSPTLRGNGLSNQYFSDPGRLTDQNGGGSGLPRQRGKGKLHPPPKTLPRSASHQVKTFLLQQAQPLFRLGGFL